MPMWKWISHVFMNLDSRSNSRICSSVNLQFPKFRNRTSVSSFPIIGWPQPSATNYSMLLNIPEMRRRRLQGGGSLKSRNLGIYILTITCNILRLYRFCFQCNNFQSCWVLHRYSLNKFWLFRPICLYYWCWLP